MRLKVVTRKPKTVDGKKIYYPITKVLVKETGEVLTGIQNINIDFNALEPVLRLSTLDFDVDMQEEEPDKNET